MRKLFAAHPPAAPPQPPPAGGPQVHEDETVVAHIMRPAQDFNPQRIQERSIEDGVSVMEGPTLTGEDAVHAVVFAKPAHTQESAAAWMGENADKVGGKAEEEGQEDDVKADRKKNAKMHSLAGVEVFAIGTWNDDTYDEDDLDEMVRAFEATKGAYKPYIKLGHSDEQEILQSEGLPSAGRVANLYRRGSKLIADFVDLPAKVYELIKRKAYDYVSSEIYWDISLDKQEFPRMLAGVALLGAEMPAVVGLRALSETLGLYGLRTPWEKFATMRFQSAATIKSYAIPSGGKGDSGMPTAEELKALQDKNKALEAEIAKQAAAREEDRKEFSTLREGLKTERTAREEAEKFAAKSRIERVVSDLEREGLSTPGARPYVEALMGPDAKEYTIKRGDKEEKLSREDLIKTVLKLHAKASAVPLGGNTEHGQRHDSSEDEKTFQAEIDKVATDQKISYSAAYRQVMRGKKDALDKARESGTG